MKDSYEILAEYKAKRGGCIKHTPKKNGKYRDGSQRWTLGNINANREDAEVFPRNFTHNPKDALWGGKDWLKVIFFSRVETQDILFSNIKMLFRVLNSTNSSDFVFDFLGETFEVIKKGKFLFLFLNDIRVLTIEPLTEKEKEQRGLDDRREAFVFEFYGKFFGLERMGLFDSEGFLRKLGEHFQWNGKPYRVDIAIDFPYGLEKIFKNSNFGLPSKLYNGSDGELETVYFGSKTEKEAFIRIYNKKVKAQKDGEEAFYPYLFNNEKIWRIETQLCSKILKGLTFADMLDEKKIMGIFRSYVQSNKKYFDFDFLEYEKIPRIRPVSNPAKEQYFISRMYKMWRSAKENKLNTGRIKKGLDRRYNQEKLKLKSDI